MGIRKRMFIRFLLWIGLLAIVVMIGIGISMVYQHLNPPIHVDPPVDNEFRDFVVI